MDVFILVHDQYPDGESHDEVTIVGVFKSFNEAMQKAVEIMRSLESPEHLFKNLGSWEPVIRLPEYGVDYRGVAMSGVGQFIIARRIML